MYDWTGMIFPLTLTGVPILAVLGVSSIFRCKGRNRDWLARTAAVFLAALALYFGGLIVLKWFGLTWRNLPSMVLLGVLLVSGWAGVVLTTACVLDQEFPNLPAALAFASKAVVCLFAAVVLVVSLWLGPLALLFGFVRDERVIEYQGQTLLEVDDGFLDPHYSYYEYHGPLVQGTERVYGGPTHIYSDIG